ncbi:MAG TPA: amidohydrolase, partial [Bacteroidia bacterium]|nr:amidohydrolase [Bacteroidia bacterium]
MKTKQALLLLLICKATWAQETFPVNGITDKRHTTYAFTHATIYTDYKTVLTDATLIIQDGIIKAVGNNVQIPAGAVISNTKGKYIYPSFIEPYGDYGVGLLKTIAAEANNENQFLTNTKGAYAWNQAIRAEVNAVNQFASDKTQAESLLKAGFGTICSFNKDGIVRGTACAVLLAPLKSQEVIIKQKAAAGLSFSKGSSSQDYPGSLMGCIALLRQTYLDAQWYAGVKSQTNLSLGAFNEQQNLPQIFDCSNWQNQLRA